MKPLLPVAMLVLILSLLGKFERLPELAVELVRIPVGLILVPGPWQVRAAKQATATIPIVFGALGVDPVQDGLVDSLARPGANVTGTRPSPPRSWGSVSSSSRRLSLAS
jgi:ABC transporter substrate binding protein